MKKLSFIIACVLMTVIACKDGAKKQVLIEQEVQNIVESFRQKKHLECRAMVLDSANKLADSIILARNTIVDTALVNGKPKKPIKPLIKSSLDTTPVEPLFKKN